MWRTSCGDRTLKGAEARLFAEALLDLLDDEDELQFEDCELGIECFDNLTYGQAIFVLHTIATGLLRDDVPAVPLTAVVEAAIAAVFQHLRIQVDIEVDEPTWWRDWRKLIIAAREETGGEELPDPTCDDLDEWDLQIQELTDVVLWDADYGDGELYLDKPPEESEVLRAITGIPQEYFLTIADDLSDEQIEAKLSELRKVCRSVIGKR